MGSDGEDKEQRTFWRAASTHFVSRALVAVCVIATARKLKGAQPVGEGGKPFKSVAPFVKPGDGWTSKLSKAQLAQLDVGGPASAAVAFASPFFEAS